MKDPLKEANNIVNNMSEPDSWLVVRYDKFNLVVDNITATPTDLIMLDGRKFKITPVKEGLNHG